MQKYKIVASKSQKKYTIIVSADSQAEAKEKLHKESYSILSISEVTKSDIEGQKFIFQIETQGNIKNGIIVGKDIFKVYVKLRDEMGYKVIFLYPEGDEAHNNAEKKQKIIDQLEHGFELQKETIKSQDIKKDNDETFIFKKEIQQTHDLVEKVLSKIDVILTDSKYAGLNPDFKLKLESIYEKLLHLRKSTNIVKLRDISELALQKIGEIELKVVESNKDSESRDLLQGTNDLLKKLGSHKKFIEADKDIKKIIMSFFSDLKFPSKFLSQGKLNSKSKKDALIDTKSYSFLKTSLLLEKYKEKLSENSKEIRKNIVLFINPFNKSEKKEKILLKRKVIQQNISILKAKKTGNISSYTSVKKGYSKTLELLHSFFLSQSQYALILILLISILFLSVVNFGILNTDFSKNYINLVTGILMLFFVYYFSISSKNIFLIIINIVFFFFLFIFLQVNF
ncbi:hypothetical protein GW846_04720 [Candidatus Gracilibacteria bacterium]|nr:hypothetical protein [Candidatus Gracilibacteria bacterium]